MLKSFLMLPQAQQCTALSLAIRLQLLSGKYALMRELSFACMGNGCEPGSWGTQCIYSPPSECSR